MGYLLINGDSRRLPIDLATVDAIVADPPYGIGYQHSGGGKSIHRNRRRNSRMPIIGDDQPFDPSPWVVLPCVFWGANHTDGFSGGSWLAWDKSVSKGPADSFADCEFAWTNAVGVKRNIFRYLWKGVVSVKAGESNGQRFHPTQKPIALMRWCIRLLKLPPNSLILDPYAGVGSTIIAALAEGHRAIGIEIDPSYCAIARRRLDHPHAAVPRPGRVEHHPLFGDAP
jgi:site-specific DNA-methyltransferase (adenine-specific)